MCSCSPHTENADSATASPATAVFTVADMTCGHCAGTIKSAFEAKLPGTAVDVDVAAKQVRVAAASKAAAAIIVEAGYTPELVA